MLQDTLRIRDVDNIACSENLIEVFRGSGEIERYLHRLRQITFHNFPCGKIGGNHWHKIKYEIMFLLEGSLDVYLFDSHKGEKYNVTVEQGQKFDLVPWVAHALYNPNCPPVKVLEFSNLDFNPENSEKDVYRIEKCLVSRVVKTLLLCC